MSRTCAILLLLTVAATVPYFVRLGATSLVDANESFYAETPREMLESGDYVNPSFNYKPRFNKPPLSYWLVVASYTMFGVSEGTARLPIALGAVILIATAGVLGWLVFGPEAGLLGALVVASSPRFLMVARRIIIDVYVSVFMGLALACFAAAELRPGRRRAFLAAMYVCVALGFLTKGPIAIVLPAAALLIYLSAHGELRRWREIMPGTGAMIVGAVVLPWYAAVYWQHGWGYITSFFLDDNVRRFTEGYGVPTPSRGALFYLPVLLGLLFPWSPMLVVALVWRTYAGIAARRQPASAVSLDGRHAVATLLAIWTLTIVGFFSLSASKQELYILPVLPAAAALVGGALAPLVRGDQVPLVSVTRVALIIGALILATAGVGLLYFIGRFETLALEGGRAIAALAAAGGLVAAMLAIKKRYVAASASLAVAVAVAQSIFALTTLPDFERYKPIPPLAKLLGERAGPQARIGYYRLASPSLVFYLRRPVFEFFDEQQLADLFASPGDVYCVMTAEDYNTVGAKLPVPSYVLARRPSLDVRLSTLLEGAPVVDVLLVSNRRAFGN